MPETNRSPVLEITTSNGVTAVVFGPHYESIYENDMQEFADQLTDLGDQSASPHVVIEMPHTKYVGSAFLGLLTRLSNRLRARGGRLALCQLTPYVSGMVSMTQLNQVFPVHATRAEAISALSDSAATPGDATD